MVIIMQNKEIKEERKFKNPKMIYEHCRYCMHPLKHQEGLEIIYKHSKLDFYFCSNECLFLYLRDLVNFSSLKNSLERFNKILNGVGSNEKKQNEQ